MSPENPLAPVSPEKQALSLAWRTGPPARLAALLGPAGMLRLCPWLLTPALLAGERVFIADGGNSFNPYDLGKAAQWVDQEPRDLLRRVHISRAFTCHQMLALVRSLPCLAEGTGCRLVVLWDPLSTFYDEAVPAHETKRLWSQTLAQLRSLAEGELLLLALCPAHPMEGKRRFLPSLQEAADRVALWQGPDEPSLRLLKPQPETFGPTFAGALAAVWNLRSE